MLKIVMIMLCGIGTGYLLRNKKMSFIGRIINGLQTLGLEAVILTLGGSAGSVLFAWALWRYVSSRGAKAVVKDKSGDVLRDDLQKGGEG